MGILRKIGHGLGWLASAALLAPVLALVPAALLDRGPGGAIRPTIFPAGLAASDPFLWDSARNSLGNAAVVALGSLVLGVCLARIVARWQFWGRRPLSAACFAAVAVPPACVALGLRLLFGPSGPWHAAWAQFAAQVGLDPHAWAWVALGWVGLTGGVPLVGLVTARALVRVAPEWEDAARLAGAGRWRIWRQVVRPMVRAEVARVVGLVFGLVLVEPAGPLLLGLRRTLAFQIVETTLRPGPAPRVALLALAALGYSLLVHGALQWWGGEPAPLATRALARRERAGHLRAPVFALVVTFISLLVWLPVAGLFGSALTPPPSDSVGGMRLTLAAFPPLARDAEVRRLAAHSVALGAAVVAFDLLLARALRGRKGGSFLAEWPEAVPPLVLGVGALVLPDVLRIAADLARGPGRLCLRTAAELFDPYRTPGVLLFVAVAALSLPRLTRRAFSERAGARDAALQLGATVGKAGRLAADRCWRERFGPLLLTFGLAATNLAPALVLVPTGESRTVTPGLLILAGRPGEGLHRAAALGACLVALNVVAFALAEAPASRLERPRDDAVY
ncbi:MAG: ABC transporter permease subunit [Isosphaeraceae bacterium]|nr:ABC transporter permease subunit [Isosphaeraceae bacterium]